MNSLNTKSCSNSQTISFAELVSPYIQSKLNVLRGKYGEDSNQYKGLAGQYIHSPLEGKILADERDRHYDAQADFIIDGKHIPGIERLYKRSVVIEPTMACAAHCRYCLRANYAKHTLSEDEMIKIAKYCGSDERKADVREVLITGGDPLIIPNRTLFLVEALIEHAPNIKIFRIATRLPQQAPTRITNSVLRIFQKRSGIRFELATQINHPVELSFPETVDAFTKFRELGVVIYSQNVLLKGINNDVNVLTELYDAMRTIGIEAHYLFHCIPLRGMSHMRTSVQQGIDLIKQLTCRGHISGRIKPMFGVMTDIGKIVLYEGSIISRDTARNRLLLQSNYVHEERSQWNASWKAPSAAEVDEHGFLRVWYPDGNDDTP